MSTNLAQTTGSAMSWFQLFLRFYAAVAFGAFAAALVYVSTLLEILHDLRRFLALHFHYLSEFQLFLRFYFWQHHSADKR